MTAPSPMALVPFVSVHNMMKLVLHFGSERVLRDLADEIEGEIQQLAPDHPVTELWQVILGLATGRSTAREITLFESVGFAVEDFTALRYVRSKLAETGFYVNLDMIADPDDPRDLFGMLLRAS